MRRLLVIALCATGCIPWSDLSAGRSAAGVDLAGVDLAGVDLAGVDLAGPAGISFVGQSTAVPTDASSIKLPAPPGVLPDDVLWLTVFSSDIRAALVSAPGWTPRGSSSNICCSYAHTLWFYRVVVAGPPPEANISFDKINGVSAAMVAYRGVSPTAPIVVDASRSFAVGQTMTAPSIANTQPGAWLVGLFGCANATSGWTAPPGMTRRAVTTSIGVFDEPIAVGESGTREAICAPGDTGAVEILALTPR